MTATDQSFEIRRAREDDLSALGRLGELLVRAHHQFDPRRFMSPQAANAEGYAWFLGSQLELPDVAVFVAQSTGASRHAGQPEAPAILGYVYAGLEPLSWKELRDPAGFIHDVVVQPTARGRGIARGLVEAAVDWLESAGAPRVMLWSAQQNDVAQRLFGRLGFRPTMIEMTRERGAGAPGPTNG